MTISKKTVALLSTSALATGAARGAILYTPINLTISGNGALTLDLNQDGAPDFQLQFAANAAAKPFLAAANTPTTDFVLSASANQGLPVTALGTLIDGSYQSAQSQGYFNQDSNANTQGAWTASGNIDGYVGLELQDGTGTHYGWAHFIYNSAGVPANDLDTGTITLVDAAMETTPDAGILAGQTAETGAAPVVVILPASQTGIIGGAVQLSVVAVGKPAPTYQWKSGAVGSGIYSAVPIGGRVSDSTTDSDGAMNTLTISNLTLANMADYVVVVSNASGAVTSSAPTTLTVLPASDSPATLVHRYSFQDPEGSFSFADSVGGPDWAGSLAGDATLTGSSLSLDGSDGTFAILPSDITSDYTQMTVEFWADIGTQSGSWTRVFSFGNQTGDGGKQSGIDFSPNANGYQNLDYLNNSGDDVYANNNAELTGQTGQHITVVVDSVRGALYYYNGTNVVSTFHDNNLSFDQTMQASSTGVPMSMTDIDDVYNVIGASLVGTDPYLNGTIYEFRIYQGVLSPQAVALNDAVGPANYIELSANPTISASRSGGNIILSSQAGDFNFVVQSRTGLSSATPWTTLPSVPALVGNTWQVSVSSTGSAQFFQLIHK